MAHKKGNRVEMLDGSLQGTIIEVQSKFCLLIKWDDGETGAVHPLDVKHLDRAIEPCMSQDEHPYLGQQR